MRNIHLVLAALALAAPAAAQQSPLAAYPGFGHNAQADEARFQQEESARETRIAQCMRTAGFQYTPTPSVRPENFPNAQAALRAARVDPNERYAASLTPERRREYYLKLVGVPDPFTEDASGLREPMPAQGGGCVGEALRAIPGVYAAAAQLAEETIALRKAVQADPRVRAAEAQWAQCMQGRGMRYDSPGAIRREADRAARTDRSQREAARARLQQANAAARECGASSGLDAAVATVRAEREAAFVQAHRQVLDQHLQRMRQPVQ